MTNQILRNQRGKNGPVVIGGIGGSGTRVVADILQRVNYYIGNDLNGALDNLAYTLLFKRKKWLYQHRNNRAAVFKGLSILDKTMTRSGVLSFSECLFLLEAIVSMSLHGHNKEKDGSGMMWPLKRLKKMCEANERHPDTFTGWGWKEPNSHLFLECLNAYFPSLKYIHTIRHGLDMAYSRNLQQLYNWGPLFGIDLPKSESEIPAAAFRYWVESNRYTLNIGEKIGPERFLVVNFDQLCAHSENELKRLLLFLDVNPNEQIMEKMAAMPQLPGSSGRFKNKDLQWLKDSDLNFLLNRGFNVE